MQRPCDQRKCGGIGLLGKSRMYIMLRPQQGRDSMWKKILERVMGPG